MALIYYAGHGIEGDGRNWLIPTDAVLDANYDLPLEAIDLDRLMELVSGARVRIVILDACRNNPFSRSGPARRDRYRVGSAASKWTTCW